MLLLELVREFFCARFFLGENDDHRLFAATPLDEESEAIQSLIDKGRVTRIKDSIEAGSDCMCTEVFFFARFFLRDFLCPQTLRGDAS